VIYGDIERKLYVLYSSVIYGDIERKLYVLYSSVIYDPFTFKVIEKFVSIIFIIGICEIDGFHYLIAFMCILN
jgi:hypothetical protein